MAYKYGDQFTQPKLHDWQEAKDPVFKGDSDLALTWINKRIDAEGGTFVYIGWVPTTASSLKSDVMYDIDAAWPTYVNIVITNRNYVWYQDKFTYHATDAVGYSDSGSSVRIADPYTTPNSGGDCPTGLRNPSYVASPRLGCIYPEWPTSKYFAAMYSIWF